MRCIKLLSIGSVGKCSRRFSTYSSHLDDPRSHEIKRIVLTGGPCGGKSTSLSYISEFLRARGYAVYLVPEAATLMMTAGVSFAGVTRDQLIDTQAELCRVQLNLEDSFFNIARSRGVPAVILSDRGAMDGKAYLASDCWTDLLKRNGWEEWDLREARYDAVCHLVTTAMGAEDFYSSKNNPMRSETAERARKIDETLQHAWLGHPHVTIIDNSTGFSGKLQRVTEFVCQQVGIPVPSERVKRFLVQQSLSDIPVPHHDFILIKSYLKHDDPNVQVRLESRTSTLPGSRPVYRYTVKRYDTLGCPPWDPERKHRVLNVRRISKTEYVAMLPMMDPDRVEVKQRVVNFVWADQYFSYVETIEPNGLDLKYVEIATSKDHSEVQLPSWLTIDRDVTDDARFTSFKMSKTTKD